MIATSSKRDETIVTMEALTPPTKPKRAFNAYNWFFKMERERLLQELPEPQDGQGAHRGRRQSRGLGFANLARTVSRNWRALSQSERAHYYELQKQDKLRHEQETTLYKAQLQAFREDQQQREHQEVEATQQGKEEQQAEDVPSTQTTTQMEAVLSTTPFTTMSTMTSSNGRDPQPSRLANNDLEGSLRQALSMDSRSLPDLEPLRIFREEPKDDYGYNTRDDSSDNDTPDWTHLNFC